MDVPSLNRLLTLEEAQRSPDGAGGFTEAWAPLGQLWADLRPGTGRERAGEVTAVSRVPYRIIVNGAPEGAPSRPRAGQRFVDGGRVFAVLAVWEHDAEARFLTCQCEEEVSP